MIYIVLLSFIFCNVQLKNTLDDDDKFKKVLPITQEVDSIDDRDTCMGDKCESSSSEDENFIAMSDMDVNGQYEFKRRKKVKYFKTYICSLDSLYKQFVKIRCKGILKTSATECMWKTPFRNFLEVFVENKIGRTDFRKNSKNIFDVIETYNSDNNTFQIGEKILRITERDISLKFGFLLHGKKIYPLPNTGKNSLPE